MTIYESLVKLDYETLIKIGLSQEDLMVILLAKCLDAMN